MIEAAHRLFTTSGYPATPIKAVAAEAGVSEQTVYRVFGDKAELLREVILTAVGGEADPLGPRHGTRVARLASEPSPAERLRIVAEWVRESYERGLAELETMVLAAAPSDERLRALADYVTEQRYADTRSIVLAMIGDAHLPPGVEPDDVVDYIYAVESSPVFTMLTVERTWTIEKYVDWFVRLVEGMFLRPGAEEAV